METCRQLPEEVAALLAAMEPRPDGRGDDPLRIEWDGNIVSPQWSHGLTAVETAAVAPSRPSIISGPQWSHGLTAVETMEEPGKMAKYRATMEPRPDGRGDL